MLRIVQLTDCHVSADPAAEYRGFDPRTNLEALLGPVRAWSPNLVLATGDLSEDGSDESYAWLAGVLGGLPVPILAIPGNHDDPVVMRQYFADCAVDTPLVVRLGGWRLVMLDSTVPGEASGRLDQHQLELLDHALEDSEQPTLVALHHQPGPVGSPWIDRYPLLDPKPFWAVLDRHPAVRLVIWGHVHQAVQWERNGVWLLGSPSSVCNSLPGTDTFTLDSAGPACRWLELESDGNFETGILRQG